MRSIKANIYSLSLRSLGTQLNLNLNIKTMWKYDFHQDPLVNRWAVSLYDTFFLPHISYCTGIWASWGKTKLKAINVRQHRILKIIIKLPPWTPSIDLYSELKVLQVQEIKNLQQIMFVYKTLNNIMPPLTNSLILSHDSLSLITPQDICLSVYKIRST